VPQLTPAQRTLRARLAAHASWANTVDPSARAANGQAGLKAKFRRELEEAGVTDPDELERRASQRLKQHMNALALKSARARHSETGDAA
jgi:hypothetical protein